MIPIWKEHCTLTAIFKMQEWLRLRANKDCNSREDRVETPSDLSETLFENEFQNRCLGSQESRDNLYELNDKITLLYRIVLEAYNGDKSKLSEGRMRHSSGRDWNTFEHIIDALRRESFDVDIHDIGDIIGIACAIRDGNISLPLQQEDLELQFRHASLNCFDFERFKIEMARLREIIRFGNSYTRGKCLMEIYRSAVSNEYRVYPGRHLKFDKIEGITSTRYKCLRILDEILCTSHHALSNDEIRIEVIGKAKRLGIYSDTPQAGKISEEDLTDTKLKKLFYILSQLINVEFNGKKKNSYKRVVFEKGHSKGTRIYNYYKEGYRMSAFTVDISMVEASRLHREIKEICCRWFNDNWAAFSAEFPLISMLGRMEKLGRGVEDDTVVINKVKESDLRTVNYKNPEFLELKKRIENIISLKLPLILKQDTQCVTVFPIAIKEEGEKWSLVAREYDKDKVLVISPVELSELIVKENTHPIEVEDSELVNHIIGTGELKYGIPFDVELVLTEEGAEEIVKNDSPFAPMNPYVSAYHDGNYEAGNSRRKVVKFKAYINTDFLRELLSLDCRGHLISVSADPPELEKQYEDYFKKVIGKDRVSYDDREGKGKRIRMPNQEIKE